MSSPTALARALAALTSANTYGRQAADAVELVGHGGGGGSGMDGQSTGQAPASRASGVVDGNRLS